MQILHRQGPKNFGQNCHPYDRNLPLKLHLLLFYPSTWYICDFFLTHVEIEGKGGWIIGGVVVVVVVVVVVGGGGGGAKGMLPPSQIIGMGAAPPPPPPPSNSSYAYGLNRAIEKIISQTNVYISLFIRFFLTGYQCTLYIVDSRYLEVEGTL